LELGISRARPRAGGPDPERRRILEERDLERWLAAARTCADVARLLAD
jgi:hypothetical protein